MGVEIPLKQKKSQIIFHVKLL